MNDVCNRGEQALSPNDHYRLKTYGVCAQRHEGFFMIRMRTSGGVLDPRRIASISEAAMKYAGGWIHLTTRQNIELHSVRLQDVPAIYEILAPAGLVGRSACGHTVRNIMACPFASTSADEPFDVGPDVQRLSQALLQRSAELNVKLPSRVNIIMGGCSSCRRHALTNDIGLVATVRDGVPGYQLWAGGSTGSAPRLSSLLLPFIHRDEVIPAVWAIISWFCDEGDLEKPSRGRLKFVIEEKGEASFRAAFFRRFAEQREVDQPPLSPISVPSAADLAACFAQAPASGWNETVLPQRKPGLATVVIRIPLGDLLVSELVQMSRLSPTGTLIATPEQNLAIRDVPVADVEYLVERLADVGLGPATAAAAIDVAACPGLSFCPLAITDSQGVAQEIERLLHRRMGTVKDLAIAVSGCPNSCTKHQVADIGFAGTKIRLGNSSQPGYQMYLGADVEAGLFGEPILRLPAAAVPAAALAAAELWNSFKRDHERPAETFRRLGLKVVAEAISKRIEAAAPPFDDPYTDPSSGSQVPTDQPTDTARRVA